MIFGISLIPLTLAAGTGLDYSRAMLVHAQLITALDAAGLAVGASPGLSLTQQQTLAQQYFNANYMLDNSSYGTPTAVSVTANSQQVTVSTSDPMPTTLMQIAGFTTLRSLHLPQSCGARKSFGFRLCSIIRAR